jgi:hypothetical protein
VATGEGNHDKAFKALMKEPGALDALLRERLPQVLDLGSTDHADVAKHPTLRAGLLALKVALLEELEAKRAMMMEVLRAPAAEAEAAKEPQVQTIAEYYVSKSVRKGMSKGLRRGLEKGLEEGLEKGRVEGRVEGRVAARLSEGDATSLQRWFDKAIDAKSLDAVFK